MRHRCRGSKRRPLTSNKLSIYYLLIRENENCFALELSHMEFIKYSLHIIDLSHTFCHDNSIAISFLVTPKKHKSTPVQRVVPCRWLFHVYCSKVDSCPIRMSMYCLAEKRSCSRGRLALWLVRPGVDGLCPFRLLTGPPRCPRVFPCGNLVDCID
mgnify:CR=1 FL=1